MKSKFLVTLSLIMTIIACSKNETIVPSKKLGNTQKQAPGTGYRLPLSIQDTAFSKFIPIDSANKMIGSYLYSIGSPDNDSDVKSFIVNADSLRSYLSNTNIKHLKLIFAHPLNYINSGYYGVNSGYESGGLTIIIAGYNSLGDYEYHNGMVLDHLAPCPYMCPPGTAADNLLSN